ncbi:MAG: undecaprenyl-diphosphate phosphatase [Thermoanaerobaculia bacterium]
MSLLQAFLLGLVQGPAEFLPISSTGHMVLVSLLSGWPDQGLPFDIAANTGSLVAVMVALRRDLARLARAWWRSLAAPRPLAPEARLVWAVLVATLPAAVAGFLARDWIVAETRNVRVIATALVGFGVLLGAADLFGRRRRQATELGPAGVLGVGLAQALALIPGTSRSGATMTAGLALGLTREAAARLSFWMAVPIGLLVAGKNALDLATGPAAGVADLPALAIGFAVSAVTSYLAIGWVLAWTRRHSLQVFVVYRVLLGLTLLALA